MVQYRLVDVEGSTVAEARHPDVREALDWAQQAQGEVRVQRWVGRMGTGHWSTVFPHRE